jgi:16S rRNA processing protein RimM
MRAAPPELVIVGRVRKAHGIRGDLVVEPITDEPDAVFAPGRRVIAGTASGDPAKNRPELHVASSQPFKGGFIIHFEEIGDRTIADTWRDRYLLVPAGELEPLGEDEVYVHELPGMRVELESGEYVGTVSVTYELPQGLALEVDRSGEGTGKEPVLIPYDRVVTRVDREARVIAIDPPAGLLED